MLNRGLQDERLKVKQRKVEEKSSPDWTDFKYYTHIKTVQVEMEVTVRDNSGVAAVMAPDPIRRQKTKLTDVIKPVLPFLTKKDVMIARMLNFEWNHVVTTMWPDCKLHAKIRESWYRECNDGCGFNVESTMKWNSVTLSHFKFYRNSSVFKSYWQNAAVLLETLTISHTSLECDGFRFILKNCPVLTTLTLDTCRFRDTTEFHNKTPSEGLCSESTRVDRDLRHLKLLGLSIFDVCHLAYLVERCQKLESMLIQECFHPPPKISVPEYNENVARLVLVKETETEKFSPQEFQKIYEDFERKLMDILAANHLVKFEFIRNNFDVQFLTKLIATLGTFQVNELTFEAHPAANAQNTFVSLEGFLTQCVGIQNIRLVFHENVTEQGLVNLFGTLRCTLQKLEMSFKGNKFHIPLDLSFLLQGFPELTRLEIQDTKGVTLKDIRRLMGGQREEANAGATVNPIDIIVLNETRIDPSFMAHLPPKLEELKLDHYISRNDPMAAFGLLHPMQNSLRKLEIHGPWIHSMSHLIPRISKDLEHLETLALTACGLDDSQITGLVADEVADMFRDLAFAFFTIRDKPASTAKEVSDSVCTRMTRPPAGPSRLSCLKNLKHLDLSCNNNISNLTLFYGLRIPGLQTLNLNGCARISDLGMHFIGLFNPGLETLNVKNCRKLSKYGLNTAVRGCKRLKRLFSTKAVELRTPREQVDPTATLSENYADIVDVSRSGNNEQSSE